MNAKVELEYLLVVDLLERMGRDGLLSDQELRTAKALVEVKYRPAFVCE